MANGERFGNAEVAGRRLQVPWKLFLRDVGIPFEFYLILLAFLRSFLQRIDKSRFSFHRLNSLSYHF